MSNQRVNYSSVWHPALNEVSKLNKSLNFLWGWHIKSVHLDDSVQWSTFVFAAIEVERSVSVLLSVCVKQDEQPQKCTSETRLMVLWQGFTGCCNWKQVQTKRKGFKCQLKVKFRNLLYVLITQVYYWAADAVQWLTGSENMFSRAGTEGEKLGKMCCSFF